MFILFNFVFYVIWFVLSCVLLLYSFMVLLKFIQCWIVVCLTFLACDVMSKDEIYRVGMNVSRVAMI